MIIRTVQNLFRAGAASASSDLQSKPFEWFAKLYLRITHAISRAQEYNADRMATRGRVVSRRCGTTANAGAAR